MTLPQLRDAEQPSTGGQAIWGWVRDASPSATGTPEPARIRVPARFEAMWNSNSTNGLFEFYTSIFTANSTADVPACAVIRTIGSLQLERLIIQERQTAPIDDDSKAFADAAVHDSLELVRRLNLSGADNIMISEDGIVSLQWRKGDHGAAMLFTGDGKVSVSLAAPGKLYSQQPIQTAVSGALPPSFMTSLKLLMA